jgi:hypothetical protein
MSSYEPPPLAVLPEPIPPQAVTPLDNTAISTLHNSRLNAQRLNDLMKLLRFDDQLAELASQRGGGRGVDYMTRVASSRLRDRGLRLGMRGIVPPSAMLCLAYISDPPFPPSPCTSCHFCTGLLIEFVISMMKTYQVQEEMRVWVPEYMTVDYLKRRIMRAKLFRGVVSVCERLEGQGYVGPLLFAPPFHRPPLAQRFQSTQVT